MRVRDWIDYIRNPSFLELGAALGQSEHILGGTPLQGGNDSFRPEYSKLYRINDYPDDLPGEPPTHIGFHERAVNVNDDGVIHAEDPAPAQRYGSIIMLWADPMGFEVQNGRPQGLHRVGYPAIIEVIGLYKHFQDGLLHRRRPSNPAVRCDHLFASWYLNGAPCRPNGPCEVYIEGYREFWTSGNYRGFSMNKHETHWVTDAPALKLDKFMDTIRGGTNLVSNHFFQNREDELSYMAEFP